MFARPPLPFNCSNLDVRCGHFRLHEELAPNGAYTGELKSGRFEVDKGKP